MDSNRRVPEAVAAALARNGIARGATVVVALSGGPDSVALLHALLETRGALGIDVAAAHLNHGLRGEESRRDEAFVRELCASLGVELIVERAQELLPDEANLEERARDVRHGFLNRSADALGARHIALGHHADDQAETVLMRAMRGAGITGLAAMAEAGPGRIIRPLLTVWRAQILDYLREIGAAYATDSSNLSARFLRNRIRHEVIPSLERDYAPDLRRRLVEFASDMRALDELVSALATAELERMIRTDGALDVARFGSLAPALRVPVLRAFTARSIGDLRSLERAHWKAMERLCAAGPPNGEVHLPGHWRFIRTYSTVQIVSEAPARGEEFQLQLAADGVTRIEAAGFEFEAATVARDDARAPRDNFAALFDAAEASERLLVRNFQPGDRIRPLGITGTRKVKEVFIDRKVPRAARTHYPVVTLADEIVWLPGLVRGRAALVTPRTSMVMKVTARALAS